MAKIYLDIDENMNLWQMFESKDLIREVYKKHVFQIDRYEGGHEDNVLLDSFEDIKKKFEELNS